MIVIGKACKGIRMKELTEQWEEQCFYLPLDEITLVLIPTIEGQELVGWYRPDGWQDDTEG